MVTVLFDGDYQAAMQDHPLHPLPPSFSAIPMESRVPEEILREILKYNLHVADIHSFLSQSIYLAWYSRSPSACDMPRSDALLVSKRWLRVGTPLFYNTIILHNSQQTQRLACVLREHADIGQAVRNIRLQGGYGKDLLTVIKHTPRIHSLSLNASVLAKDSNAGLLRSLPLMNPSRLYIHGFSIKTARNQKSLAIKRALFAAIQNWSVLVGSTRP